VGALGVPGAKAQPSALMEKLLAGEEVIIGKAGKPVAKLVCYDRSREPRRSGALKGPSLSPRDEKL